jgi:hypothetical protein
MKTLWVLIAVVCVLGAAVLFFRQNFEAAFVVAAIGAVAWFLNYRQQVKRRLGKFDSEDQSIDQGGGMDEGQNVEDSLS